MSMRSLSTLTTPLLLVLFILIPLYLINSNSLLSSSKQLPYHTCMNNGYYHKKVCITCTLRNDAQVLTGSKLIIKNINTDILTINVPIGNFLQCQQILQMVDYSNLDKYNSVTELQFEDVSAITQIVEQIKITTSKSRSLEELAITSDKKMIGIIQLTDRTNDDTQIKLSFIPKKSEILLSHYFKLCSIFSAIFLLGYLAYTLSNKQQIWYRLVVCLSISILVGVITFDEQINSEKDLYMLKLARCLLIGLIFMKIGAKKLLVACILFLSYLVTPQLQFYYVLSCSLLFILIIFIKGVRKNTGVEIIMQILLLLLIIICQWMKIQTKIQFTLLAIIIEFNTLIFGPILLQIKNKQEQVSYEKLPYQSGLSLPGFQGANTFEEDDDQQN